MSPELYEILEDYGREPTFAVCQCALCATRTTATVRQALHSVLGQRMADSIIEDMGPHWAITAALCVPDGPRAAVAALRALTRAGITVTTNGSAS